jgi:hypothetical protein
MFLFNDAEANPHESGSEPKSQSRHFDDSVLCEKGKGMEVDFEQLRERER